MKKISISALFLLAYVLVGCNGGNSTPPTTTDAGSDSGTTQTDAGTDSGTTDVDSGTEIDAGVDAGPTCVESTGCFDDTCSPTEASPSNPDLWFLNHCNSGYCAPFDNATRIPNYVGQP